MSRVADALRAGLRHGMRHACVTCRAPPPASPCATPDHAPAGPLDPKAVLSCEVCMSEVPGSECARNGCGHTFCRGCWSGHLQAQISDGKARHVTCMAYKCGVVCDEELVTLVIKVGFRAVCVCVCVADACGVCACRPFSSGRSWPPNACTCCWPLLQDESQLLQKYKQSHLESYMEDNHKVAFCPSVPWCGRAVEVRWVCWRLGGQQRHRLERSRSVRPVLLRWRHDVRVTLHQRLNRWTTTPTLSPNAAAAPRSASSAARRRTVPAHVSVQAWSWHSSIAALARFASTH
jgi:hypothetical protein